MFPGIRSFSLIALGVLGGCAINGQHVPRSTWSDQVAYHTLLVTSQYKEHVKVVVARLLMPGETPGAIEQGVAIPLEKSIGSLAGVRKVKTRSVDGAFLMEVHFEAPPGNDQMKDVRQIVENFWNAKSPDREPPIVTLDKPTILY